MSILQRKWTTRRGEGKPVGWPWAPRRRQGGSHRDANRAGQIRLRRR